MTRRGVEQSAPRRTGGLSAIVVGVVAVAVSLVGVVTLPLVATLVAAWWATLDARDRGAGAPGRLGKAALVLLAVAWGAAATLVLSFDTHFDCGGTLGGFGESANARLDESCVDRRSWRTLVGLVGVVVGTVGAGVMIRRRSRTAAMDAMAALDATDGTARRVAMPAATIAVLAVVWVALIGVLIVS